MSEALEADDDVRTRLVDAIGAVPGLADQLLADHIPDPAGRCRLCTVGSQIGWERWPCRMYSYAAAARAADRSPPESR